MMSHNELFSLFLTLLNTKLSFSRSAAAVLSISDLMFMFCCSHFQAIVIEMSDVVFVLF